MRFLTLAILTAALTIATHANEEKIRGVLEKSAKLDACAQVTDALNELYYVAKTDAAEKMIASYVGKNQRVQLVGTIENKPNETVPFINLKSVEAYAPKLPAALTPPTEVAPISAEKKEEKKPDAVTPPKKELDEKK